MQSIELLGDVRHVESHFGPFGHGVFVGARQLHGFAPNVP
jgi:hypothetical protein